MSFFGRPISSLDVANAAQLATLIGGAVPTADSIGGATNLHGSRLVDNLAQNHQATPAGPGVQVFSFIDCTAAQSFSLQVVATQVGLGNGTATVVLQWFTGGVNTLNQTYELNTGNPAFPVNTTTITDLCRGDTVNVLWDLQNGIAIDHSTWNLVLSSRMVMRPRVSDNIKNGAVNDSFDMLLGTWGSTVTGVLAIGATAPLQLYGLTTGRIFLRCSARVSAMTMTFSWGLVGTNHPFVLAVGIVNDVTIEIPAPNRPLRISCQNTGGVAAGQWAALAWTTDD